MAETPVIDPQAIENLRALNPGDNDEFVREIASIYLEDTPQRIGELDSSLAASDPNTFTRAAHSIKGSSANVGALTVRAVAERLEQKAREEGLGGVASLLAELKTEFGRAQLELSKLVGK